MRIYNKSTTNHTCISSLRLEELNVSYSSIDMVGHSKVSRFICRKSWPSVRTHVLPNCLVSFCFSILGVWSVSSLISDEKENKASTGTWSSNRETDADNDKQSKKICLFTDRPIAPLVIYDSLDTISEEHCFSPALDREIRIKELLRKREKLLEEVRQNRTTSQINLL